VDSGETFSCVESSHSENSHPLIFSHRDLSFFTILSITGENYPGGKFPSMHIKLMTLLAVTNLRVGQTYWWSLIVYNISFNHVNKFIVHLK